MAKKPTPLAGEATTTNYGWVKPTVGSSVDLWGGYINADLDSIDSVVHAIDTRPVGVTVSDTPPANPLVGQEWFDGVSGQLYVWYDDGNSSQWVIAVNATASLLPASTTVLGAVKVDGTTIKAAPDGTIRPRSSLWATTGVDQPATCGSIVKRRWWGGRRSYIG